MASESQSSIAKDLASLYLNGDYADITLVVEGERLPAHRVILAVRSEYFRVLLYGGLKESEQREIQLNDMPLEAFKALLRYIYTDYVPLETLREDVILDIWEIAHRCGFLQWEKTIVDHLIKHVSFRNVNVLLEAASLYGAKELKEGCCKFADEHAEEILSQGIFLRLARPALIELFKRDSFVAPDLAIFEAVAGWCKAQNGGEHEDVVECARLPLISVSDLLTVVRPSKLISTETILDLLTKRAATKIKDLPHRGFSR